MTLRFGAGPPHRATGSSDGEKDCGCLPEIHAGPHWLHMDRFERKRNEGWIRRGIETGDLALAYRGIQAEIARLHEKAIMLEREERKHR